MPKLIIGKDGTARMVYSDKWAPIARALGALEITRDPPTVPTLLAAFPTMHAAWGLGFVRGIVKKVDSGVEERVA